jgi:hypothetical protein
VGGIRENLPQRTQRAAEEEVHRGETENAEKRFLSRNRKNFFSAFSVSPR